MRLTKFLLLLVGLVVVAVGVVPGAWSLLSSEAEASPGPAVDWAGAFGAVTSELRDSPDVYGLAGLALVAGSGGLLAGAWRRRLRRLADLVPFTEVTREVLDPVAVREACLQLAASLKPTVEANEPDMVLLMDTLIRGAIQLGASDLHFQPLEAGTHVAFRVGGVLEDVLVIPARHHPRLVMRVKVLSRLVTYVSDRPQDGHLSVDGPAGATDIRVSLLPTSHGEKVVLRVARAGVRLPDLAGLGFPAHLLPRFLGLLARPQGLIFLTGPTGSGKTTTIYASLAHIKQQRGETTHIATIEDPVEFDVPFLTQTQVRPEAGLNFAQGLRSMLRQDPNVMMVGEIRDAETARIAIQAGLSGHLILTTVHAESAAGVFNRLIEIGVEPFLLASATQAAVSQRLVRALCPHCRRQAAPSPAQVEALARQGLTLSMCFEPVGCPRCGNRGYLGRTALYELLEVTPAVRELLIARVPTPQIVEGAAKEGMQPLLAHGLEQVLAGATSLDEVLRVAG